MSSSLGNNAREHIINYNMSQLEYQCLTNSSHIHVSVAGLNELPINVANQYVLYEQAETIGNDLNPACLILFIE